MYKDKVLGLNESSDRLLIVGNCDICIHGLSSGTVKLQYLLKPSDELPSPDWWDFPEGEFSEDIYKTIFISDDTVTCRLTGVSNNAGVYVRLSRYLNN